MNKEIKEIVNILYGFATDVNSDYIYDAHGFNYPLISDCIEKLLDYITNLQEQLHQASLDIQELTERDIECPSWCDKLTNLQEENQRLNENNQAMQEEMARTWKIADDYKTRIDKATEYIEENCIDDEFYVNLTNKEKHIIKALKILKGE